MAMVMIGLGLYTVSGRGTVELRDEDLPNQGAVTIEDLQAIDAHELPCCCGGKQ
jgi:hypothetical protein